MLFSNLLSCIFLLFLLNPFLSNAQNSPPLSFLKIMVGALKGHNSKGVSELKKHLSYLGYMKQNEISENNDLFDDNLELALKDYQMFFNLKANGILDNETVEKLLQPRCGVPDFVIQNKNRIQSQNDTPITVSHYTFFPGNLKWPPTNKVLTYSFFYGTRDDVMKAIMNATSQWTSVAPFKFQYIEDYNQADIKISFQWWNHGDGHPFDGRGGVLAHAFAPTDGRLHFDGDEMWTNGIVPGNFDLETIGLHELGHVLGLGHSNDGGSIMFPAVGPGVRKGLAQDDINGIKALYHI